MAEATTGEKVQAALQAIGQGLLILAGLLAHLFYGAVRACLPYSLLPHKSVRNELVLITGAGGGFGRLLAERFAKLGARLVLCDIDEKLNGETVKLCKALGAEVHSYRIDLNNRENTYEVGEKIKKDVGDIDILVNNAGIVTGKALVDCSDDQIQRTMTINAISHFWTYKLFLPSMMKRNHGHIVAVTSAAGLHGTANLTDYCSSKFAAVGLFESLSLELLKLEKDQVKCTMICPTFMNTGMFAGAADMVGMPVMQPSFVADQAMEAILTDQVILCVPKIVYFLTFMKSFMPINAGVFLAKRFGSLNAMDKFQGKN